MGVVIPLPEVVAVVVVIVVKVVDCVLVVEVTILGLLVAERLAVELEVAFMATQ